MPERAPGPALRVSVVVPHYNDLPGLDRCLDALVGQSLPRDAFEIVVVDNNSPQGRDAVAKVVGSRARLEVETAKGAGPARNTGVAAARAPLIAFTDSDCVPEADWLERLIAHAGEYDIVGGRMVVLVGAHRAKTGAEAFEQVFAFQNEKYIRTKGFSVSANLLCSQDVFARTGPFLGAISEDLEWCQRAVGKGMTLGYADDAVVGHPAREDWTALLKKWRRISAESEAMAGSSLPGRLKWLARSWLLPASIVAHAPKIWLSRDLRSGAERRRALGTLARIRLWRIADTHRRFFGGGR